MLAQRSGLAHGAPWVVYSLAAAAALLMAPSLPVVALVGVGYLLVSRIQQRRQRASLAIEDGEIVVVNRFSNYRIPLEGVSMAVGRDLEWPAVTFDEEHHKAEAMLGVPRVAGGYVSPCLAA